jgi:hypothetical protein
MLFLALPSTSKLAGDLPEAREGRGRLPSDTLPLPSLLFTSGFPDLSLI